MTIQAHVSPSQGMSRTTYDSLYNNYAGPLYGYVRSLIEDELQANKIFEEIFTAVCTEINQHDPLRQRIFTFMLVIANKKIARYQEKNVVKFIMHGLPIPPNDEIRLSALYQYDILDSPAENCFDDISRMAAQAFSAPNAFITFVDRERVFCKSGLIQVPGRNVSRKYSLCARAVLDKNAVTVINDTHFFADLKENPLVNCRDGIRFYAGASLNSPEGHKLGSLCVLDSRPHHQVTQKQINILTELSHVVMNHMENRKLARMPLQS